MSQRRSRRNTATAAVVAVTDAPISISRARRTASATQSIPLATVSRAPSSSPSSHQSLHLMVRLPSSKLRQATRMAPPARSSAAAVSVNSRDRLTGGQIIEGKRARNVKKSYIVESDSDEEDEEMEDAGEDEEAEEESPEDDEEMGDEDAEGEDDEDADGDIDMDIPPPPPVIKISRPDKNKKPVISVKPSGKSDGRTVEVKEVAEVSDDEELSELESEMEEEEEGMQLGNEEDAEGEEEEIEVVDDEEEDDDDELDSDDETPAGGSRASTPDLTKLTKRQRARLEEGGSGHLLALPDEVQTKKHLTAEEHAMRRAEMARRRKNLSEKRNEEEKMETINKLLKKQAPKTNSRRAANGLKGADADASPDSELQKANPVYVRWVSNRDGNRIGVPEEWLEAPVGAVFGAPMAAVGMRSGAYVEEVQ